MAKPIKMDVQPHTSENITARIIPGAATIISNMKYSISSNILLPIPPMVRSLRIFPASIIRPKPKRAMMQQRISSGASCKISPATPITSTASGRKRSRFQRLSPAACGNYFVVSNIHNACAALCSTRPMAMVKICI